jgi:prolipoprotein diacylglyceryltransferase
MAPDLLGPQTYHLFWAGAISLWVVGGLALATREGFGPGRSAAAFAVMLASVLIGAKLQHLWENPGRLSASWSILLMDGYRLPGGIALSFLVVPFGLTKLGLPLLSFLDTIIPVAGFSLAAGRVGCYLNGCCFGTISDVPWAIRFPAGSRAYATHEFFGFNPPAGASLPVHPLQLYYLAAYLGIGLLLLVVRAHPRHEGWRTHLFTVLWAWSTVILESFRSAEPFRAQPHTQRVALVIALIATSVLIASRVRHRRLGGLPAR